MRAVLVTDVLEPPGEMPEEVKIRLGLTKPIYFGPYMYVPVTFLTQAFGAGVKVCNNGLNAEITTKARDVMYISDHFGELTNDTAEAIKMILKD